MMDNKEEHILVRPSGDRGHADLGWLKTFHTFSFGDYHDPRHMGFRSLRVINEDYVEGAKGFGRHPHKDMEILTYVLKGALEHKDSMGNTSVIRAGDIQKMSAGTGVFHSEINHSGSEEVHLLQIWILPNEKNLPPSYEQYSLANQQKEPLLMIGSPDGGPQVVRFHQDVYIYRGLFKKDQEFSYSLKPGRGLWIQAIEGSLEINGRSLVAGDGAGIQGESKMAFKSREHAQILLFDLK